METATILIIDDDPVCTGVLLSILGDDYHVTTANSGSGGIDIIDASIPSLVLLDITMPEVNGYQVIQHLKSDPRTADIPIVVISTLVEDVDRALALKLGANDYINKPVMPKEVQDKVYKYLHPTA